jgi:hypothetical protein
MVVTGESVILPENRVGRQGPVLVVVGTRHETNLRPTKGGIFPQCCAVSPEKQGPLGRFIRIGVLGATGGLSTRAGAALLDEPGLSSRGPMPHFRGLHHQKTTV